MKATVSLRGALLGGPGDTQAEGNDTSAFDLQGLLGASEVAEGCARRLKGLRVLGGPDHGYPCHHPEPLGCSVYSLGEIPVSVYAMAQEEEGR